MAAPSATGPKSLLELRFRCAGLKSLDMTSKSDPLILVSEKRRGGEFKEVGRTEVIPNNSDPEFLTTVSIEYLFEESQQLKIEVYDVDDKASLHGADLIGTVECTLAEIVGKPGCRLIKDIVLPGHHHKRGSLLVTALEVANPNKKVNLKFRAEKLDKKDFLGKSDPFFNIFRKEVGVLDSRAWSLVYKSEVVKNTLDPHWKQFTVGHSALTGGKDDAQLRIEVFDWDADSAPDLIGNVECTFAELVAGVQSKQPFEVINPKKKEHGPTKMGFSVGGKYANSGLLFVESLDVFTQPSFYEYLRGGFELNFVVAIDFTGSNGDPKYPNSLHFIDPNSTNQYEAAITSVGSIISYYDQDRLFPAFLFGGKLQDGTVSHCYPLNGNNENPFCPGVEGIMQSYGAAITNVSLWGPTNFAPVINRVISFAEYAKSQHQLKYFVLLIITDGEITDFDETKEAIVTASGLPMSLIIIGVGGANFDMMSDLDADKGPLKDRKGRQAERDIVQFVAFRDYPPMPGNAQLAADVLAEIPNQFVSYCATHRIPVPNPPPPPVLTAPHD